MQLLKTSQTTFCIYFTKKAVHNTNFNFFLSKSHKKRYLGVMRIPARGAPASPQPLGLKNRAYALGKIFYFWSPVGDRRDL